MQEIHLNFRVMADEFKFLRDMGEEEFLALILGESVFTDMIVL